MSTLKKESAKLPRAPLIFVLAQVRFNPVSKMEYYVPDIQEYLRHHGFPWYRLENIQNIMIGPDTKAEITKRWIFDDVNHLRQVILTTDAITFQTTAYDTFDRFLSDLNTATQPLVDHAKVELIQQIGLRYVDLLTEIDGSNSRDLVKPGFSGISGSEIAAGKTAFSFVLQAQTPSGVLTIRSVQLLDMQAFLPPDIGQTSLRFPDRVSNPQNARVLDFDHITQKNLPFNCETLSRELTDLHEYTDKAFRAVTTEQARQLWGKEQ